MKLSDQTRKGSTQVTVGHYRSLIKTTFHFPEFNI